MRENKMWAERVTEYARDGWVVYVTRHPGGWFAHTMKSPYICVHGDSEEDALWRFDRAREFYTEMVPKAAKE